MKKKLSEFFATAICGNDILSSALYVSGIAIIFSGIYAPIVLLIVAGVLFLYKFVYTEVVEALPVNGGAYNCLLNATSKTIAAIAGIITFLSYVATAVISAKIGVEYLNTIVKIPVIPSTIALLLFFACLVILGIKDSAKVAGGIFVAHIATLSLFLLLGFAYLFHGHSFLLENLHATDAILKNSNGFWFALYLGFSASLLGISGFESSANFVEEQKPGVFRKTLKNMLLGVTFFNPLIALVVLNSFPIGAVAGAKDFLLADVSNGLGGIIFRYVISLDAFIVLSGAVLTSYVGVSGLLKRMALDNCIPFWFHKENKRGGNPRILLGFFLLCTSIILITRGELLSLAGLYTIAFLSVMTLFAIGNLILKKQRTELKRTYSAPSIVVFIAGLFTMLGIIGNIRLDQKNLVFFEWYFIPFLLLILFVIYQDYVVKFLMQFTARIPFLNRPIEKYFKQITDGRFVVFIRHVNRLYPILEYIHKNETGLNITLVHCKNNTDSEKKFKEIKQAIPVIQEAGVFPKFNIDLIDINEPFGPKVVKAISKKLGIEGNRIFIGSIHNFHDFDYDELRGSRIIF